MSAMVQDIVDALPDDNVKGEPFGVNIAGNGLKTLAEAGVDQESLDVLLTSVSLALKERGINVSSLRSGGQTVVDESAVAMAKAIGAPVTVHAPAGYVFRGASGKDVADEGAFKARFAAKDYDVIRAKASKIVPSPTRKKGQVNAL